MVGAELHRRKGFRCFHRVLAGEDAYASAIGGTKDEKRFEAVSSKELHATRRLQAMVQPEEVNDRIVSRRETKDGELHRQSPWQQAT